MSRESVDQYDKYGLLINGYDYIHQAWVIRGKYDDCGHPRPGEPVPALGPGALFPGCNCYGRAHKGERSQCWFDFMYQKQVEAKNNHHPDCDAQEHTHYNLLCSMLCPMSDLTDRQKQGYVV
jgi:hypothetical protein